MWAWGDNASGQVGDGTKVNRSSPVQVAGAANVAAISAGAAHSLAVTRDGRILAWGSNASGTLGTGSAPAESLVPVSVTGIAALRWAIATGSFPATSAGGAP